MIWLQRASCKKRNICFKLETWHDLKIKQIAAVYELMNTTENHEHDQIEITCNGWNSPYIV